MKTKNNIRHSRTDETIQIKQASFSQKFSGFTLVELIVVITILVILGTISFLQLGGFAGSARDSRRVSDMANITQAIELAVVTQGNAPIPTNPVSYTGGSVTLQIGVVTNTIVPKMSGDFSDPITKLPYNYSVFGNGLYYQLGIDFENPLSYHTNSVGVDMTSSIGIPGIDTVYADNGVKYSKLSGSYKFDPSLPSLFVLPGTVNSASGGIFSPDVCFILNNVSTNSFSSSSGTCVAKKKMNLKDIDSSLVGYWDMETLTGGLLRDLSGNGNDGVFSGTVLPISTGAILGKGYYFQGSGTGSSLNWGMFYTSGAIGYQGAQEISAEMIVKTVETCPQDNLLDGPFYSQVLLESSNNMNTNTGAWTIGDFDYSNSNFQGCRSAASVHINTASGYFITRGTTRPPNNVWKILTLRTSYSVKTGEKETAFFINGIKQEPTDGISYRSKITESFRDYPIYIGARSTGIWSVNGIIDDIKIYNRALSVDEIKQHAKIVGL